MATKSKKSSSAASSTTIEVTSTPVTPSTPSRPVSPARLSRIQERNELQHLNDRLAGYIERVRQLETENSKLKVQIQKSYESREIVSIKKLYESELGDTRNSLDVIAKEKAQLELLLSRTQEDLKTLEAKFNKKQSEYNSLEKKAHNQEAQIDDLKGKVSYGVGERKRLEGELKALGDELKTLEDKLKALKKQLEEETILRVDLENRNQSLNEELTFQRQLYQKELEEVRHKEFEVKEVYTENLKEQFEAQLAEKLREVRADTDSQINFYRQELEDRYDSEISALIEESERRNGELNAANTKIKQLNSTYLMSSGEVDSLKQQNSSLQAKVTDLNKLIEQERQWSKAELAQRDVEINILRDKLEALIEEHKDLVDDKIKMDAELAVYRKLLEGEETRLNISPQVSSTPSSVLYTPRQYAARGNKRKRICLQEEENEVDVAVNSTSKGDVEISDHDQDGKFVKLFNKGDKEIALGGWQLLRKADDLETRFKFHRSIAIKPNSTVTVWSSDANAYHSPPSDVVMKSQTWFTADNMLTTLLNNNNEEVAFRKTEKRNTSRLHRVSHGYLNENDVDGQQKCSVM